MKAREWVHGSVNVRPRACVQACVCVIRREKVAEEEAEDDSEEIQLCLLSVTRLKEEGSK